MKYKFNMFVYGHRHVNINKNYVCSSPSNYFEHKSNKGDKNKEWHKLSKNIIDRIANLYFSIQ